MLAEILRKDFVGTTLVFGLAGTVVHLLISAEQPLGIAWVEVVGPSKIVGIALFAAIYAWLGYALSLGKYTISAALVMSITISGVVPVEYWSVALISCGLWSATRYLAVAPSLIALGILGLHIALVGDRLPALLSFALHVDTTLTAALIELSGRVVDVRGTILTVEEGISLRLIGPCSSILPMLTVAGAIGSALGVVRLGTMKRAYIAIGLGALGALCLNVSRLAAMSTSNLAYEWLHAGAGAVVFRMLILAMIVVTFALIVLWRHISETSDIS